MFRWTLKDTMDANGVTRYALQKETGLAMNTVRAMYDGTPTRVDFPVIEKIVTGLAKLTGKKISPDDVFRWEAQ
jgi:DNA-binding Xre family transcriptional regulator